MSYNMADISGLIPTINSGSHISYTDKIAQNSTNKKAGASLEMNDFLKLMVTMFQNQSMDDQMDTSQMMTMMVNMSVVEAISNISTLISDSTQLTYAASLVGKKVTIGQYDAFGKLQELYGEVTGTGTLGGKQIIFLDDDKSYYLTDVLAVGKLPGVEDPAETTPVDPADKSEETGKTDETNKTEETGKTDETNKTEETGSGEISNVGENPGSDELSNVEETEETGNTEETGSVQETEESDTEDLTETPMETENTVQEAVEETAETVTEQNEITEEDSENAVQAVWEDQQT